MSIEQSGQLLDEPLLALTQSLTSSSSSIDINQLTLNYQQQILQQQYNFNNNDLLSTTEASTSDLYNLIQQQQFNDSTISSITDMLNFNSSIDENNHNDFKIDFTTNINDNNNNNIQLSTLTCEYCKNDINSKTYLLIENKLFHETCARCYECGCQFDGKCYFRNGMMLCRNDYILKFTKQCERCQCPIDTQTLVMNVRNSIFHLHCFSCIICGEMLRQGEKFAFGSNGILYCYLHMNPLLLNESPNTNSNNDSQLMETIDNIKSKTKNRTTSKSDNQDDERESSPERGNNQKTKRMRTSFKHHQLREMKRYFQLNHNPDAKDLRGLAQKTGLTKRVLQVWFQNARAKYRRSQNINSDTSISPNGCILPQIKLEQYYPTISSTSLSDTSRTSVSPFDGQNTNSSYSRSISPELSGNFEEQSAPIAV